MIINKLRLQNFRNHVKREWEYGQKVAVLGENGSGKSNMLEAIYMLATGKSFRADKEDEMISYGEQVTNVECTMNNLRLRILLTDGTVGVTRKKFEVNGVPKRMIDFVGKLRAVLFGPEDMELVTGSPSGRRRYLDFVITQTDREYRRCLVSYEKGLRQRNKILERIREGTAGRSQLFFWDKLLVKNGEYLTIKREEYLSGLSDGAVKRLSFKAVYDKSVISETRLNQYEIEEVAAAATLVGPHRDDFQVMVVPDPNPSPNLGEGNYRDVSKYGSRGEQRMAVMWLKMGELHFLEQESGRMEEYKKPVLLLDDIFSELDHRNRLEIEEEVGRLTNSGGQVIMTTADEHNLPQGKNWTTLRL